MRILVLADIHSNWAALQAVAEAAQPFDACLFLGDLVDYGTDPVPCISWVKRWATVAIRGNHDHAVAQRVVPRGNSGLRRLAAATRPLHWEGIDPARTKYLARLPISRQTVVDGKAFHLVHATPRDPLDEYLLDDLEGWRARLQKIEADFVCVGHTHVQFDLAVDDIRVINPGSVGQPRDGDPRAAYAIVTDGQVSLERVEYDIDAALTQMRTAGVEDWVVAFSEQLLRSGGKMTREEMDDLMPPE
ncbi:phosphodiesterase [Maioricimonas rarisocia]|uniref:Phosphodiesterase n=1 Tax=Maioricimonas rarisocia TaxID=2528026 RepID=A0A517Z628_9PLAN|nr:metallophosphoesterase family protein [Maioricimonas rarisocia]QDU37960.1 phosphodiesterase [Maioricimonas rarisocia]